MFNVIPNNVEEINTINPSLEKLYNHIVKNFNIINPFAFDLKKPKTVKICRMVAYKLNLSYWKKIYSNLVLKIGDGTRSENKGIKFEKELEKNINDYLQTSEINNQIKEILKIIPKDYNLISVDYEGNHKPNRLTKLLHNHIDLKSNYNNISSDIADLVLNVQHKNTKEIKKLNLSLKYGDVTSFANYGIKHLVNEKEIKSKKINDNLQHFLNIFEIDKNIFCDIFNLYKKETNSIPFQQDLTEKLKDSDILLDFIKSSIGHDYYIVHKKRNGDITTRFLDKNFIDTLEIKSVIVDYPKIGQYKQIKIFIKLNNNCELKLYIRNTQGEIYPNQISVQYKFN